MRRDLNSASDDPTSNDAWPGQPVDAYVRGNDLVASYAPTSDWPYSPQISWSVDTLASIEALLGSLSLVISVETQLLDTCPRFTLNSQLPADEVLQVIPAASRNARAVKIRAGGEQVVLPQAGPCCLLWRLRGENISYAEIMPPSDFRQLAVRHDCGEAIARWDVFGDFLEKGVIRRARLAAVFLPRENDVELSAAYCRETERRPPPLTA
jgi:hypothetical protein